MATVTKTRKARQRTIKLALPIGSEPGSSGVVEIRQNGKLDRYLVAKVASDFGSGFRVSKVGSEDEYHVNLTADGHSCECKGFLRWNRCKHSAGLAALQQAGKL